MRNYPIQAIVLLDQKYKDLTSDYEALAAQRDEGLAREAELQREIERLRGLPHGQILAEAAAKHLLDSGAENFVGEVFTIEADDGKTNFEVVVTTQKVGAKSPGEVCNELQQRLSEAEKDARDGSVLLSAIVEWIEDGFGGSRRRAELLRKSRSWLNDLNDSNKRPGCADGEKAQ